MLSDAAVNRTLLNDDALYREGRVQLARTARSAVAASPGRSVNIPFSLLIIGPGLFFSRPVG